MLASRTLLSSVLLVAAAAAACTKSDPPAPTTPSATATASATPSATASAAPTASAEPTTDGTAAATATATATASGTAEKPAAKDAGTATAAASGSAGAPECGTKPLPDCPLQAWMKSNANPPVMTNDVAALEPVLTKIAGMAPPGYGNWATIAKDGAKAAKGGDMTAAKASCRTCHDQYKQKYKTEMRGRKI